MPLIFFTSALMFFIPYRKRPKGVASGVERTIELLSKKDARQDSMSSVGYQSNRGGKDLKAKSIAAALERVTFLSIMTYE